MLTEKSSEVTAAVKAVGDQVEGLLGTHCKQPEVWKAVRHMMSSEDAWLYRGQPVDDAELEACEKQTLLAMMGTSVEVQRVSALRRGAGVVALVYVAKATAVISVVNRRTTGRVWRWSAHCCKDQ